MAHGPPKPSPTSPESQRRGFEIRDASVRGLFIFALCMVVAAGIIHLAAYWAYRATVQGEGRSNEEAYPVGPLVGSIPTRPPEPALQPQPQHDILPRADLEEVRARQRSIIGAEAWGWADADHHFARIPVNEAIEMAVDKGLPVSLPATRPTTQPFMPPASAMHGPGGVP